MRSAGPGGRTQGAGPSTYAQSTVPAGSAVQPESGKDQLWQLGLQGKSAGGKGWWAGEKEPAPGGGQLRGGRPHPPST